jgi:thiol:disulfide interchange protein DsbD
MTLLSAMARWLLLLLLLLGPVAGQAAESSPAVSPRATVLLLAERSAIAPGQPFRVLLHQRLARGWHTYWINPGDAGAPPELRFDLPAGWRAGPLLFPAPRRIPYGPLLNFGYTGEAGFLLELTPPADLLPGETVTLRAEASWLVCADLCIPEEAEFTLTLPVAASPAPANLARFLAAEAALPRPAPFAARVAPDGALTVEGAALSPDTVRGAEFFPLAAGLIENPAPQRLSTRAGGLTLLMARGPEPLPDPVEGVLVLTDAGGQRSAFSISARPGAAAAGTPLWRALALALLGGLVLNLMPCVFPILAMKAMALARLGGAARAEVRREAAGYTLGVVGGFLALGGVLIALRAAGAAAGWGFQFTEPGLVAALSWLMLAVGLNLSGVYAVRGPSLGGVPSRWGSVGTGLLAVAVATPCTAPFMAAAIGAALLLPPGAALLVFGALGLGMALPYAILGLLPGAARILPRPGAWMERLRRFLAFPMYAAAAWLVWVLAQQAGPDGVLIGLGGGVLVALAAWALGEAQGGTGAGARWGRGGAVLALLAALALLPAIGTAPAAAQPGREPWSAERVAELQAAGRPVFVNLTAAWCISCKVNEALVLDTAAVRAAFAARNVALLTGDWTRGDAAITALLRAQGRDGVPLYLLYPPGEGAPALLPQILSEGALREALGKL